MRTVEPEIPKISKCYPTLPSLIRKFERYGRRDYFHGGNLREFEQWKKETRSMLKDLLGLDKMETCGLEAVIVEEQQISDGIRRQHVKIQVEPDVWLTMYILIPADAGPKSRVFICPHGHKSAGKYAVAGCSEYSAVAEKIAGYQYDYGYQLAKMGYVAVCTDSRGAGERREELKDAEDREELFKCDCYWLAHMGEPLGIPVAGFLTWDLMRVIDYIKERKEWADDFCGCLGFSGGGMQTLWLAALDERISLAVISGYMYGFRDALLKLNKNCSCNYVPHLWEHVDMGDIASLIAPRPLLIQSCKSDRLNGERGLINAVEQVDIIKKNYQICGVPEKIYHDICEGNHQWHGENLKKYLEEMTENHRWK